MVVDNCNGIGIANLPNQLHRIVSHKFIRFNLMIVGEAGLGKRTFLSTLLHGYSTPTTTSPTAINNDEATVRTQSYDIREREFSTRLTVITVPGFGDHVDNTDCWVPVVQYIDDQFIAYQKAQLLPSRLNYEDTRVHACLYFIPSGLKRLRPLDIETMRALHTRINLIPIISKADTLMKDELMEWKTTIRKQLHEQGIQVFKSKSIDHDELGEMTSKIMSAMPYAVIGSGNTIDTPDGRTVCGRLYPWGTVEIDLEDHCDFKKLRCLLIRTHMNELIETTEEDIFHAHLSAINSRLLPQKRQTSDPSREERLAMQQEEFKKVVEQENLKFKEREKNFEKLEADYERQLETEEQIILSLEKQVNELTRLRQSSH